MEVLWFKHLPSTHKYLISQIKEKKLQPPVAIGCDFQSAGVGSRGNEWIGEEGNLFLSFCVKEKHLPKDLKLESTSIYFSYLLKELLEVRKSKVWIKWPNDFYIENRKVGGVITTKIGDTIIGSIGLNIAYAPNRYGVLDLSIAPRELVELYVDEVKKNISWKKVFSKYKVEFQKSLGYTFHMKGKKISLQNATLCEDGSIEIENKRVYSLR